MIILILVALLALSACKSPYQQLCDDLKAKKEEILSRSENEPITEDDVLAVQEHFERCVMSSTPTVSEGRND